MTPSEAKAASQEFLEQHSVEINGSLPLIESLDDLRPQDASAVAIRSIVLCYVIGIGFGADPSRLKSALEEFGLFEQASEKERELLSRSRYSQQEKINATWQTECVQSLAWCLGLIEELNPFRRCNDDLADNFPPPFSDPAGFIAEAALRPIEEIYQQVDLHYRLHWAARNARLLGRSGGVEEELISERRKALDWVIGVGSNWDEIPLDT